MLLGATAVTFAVGLSTLAERVVTGCRTPAQPVQVSPPAHGTNGPFSLDRRPQQRAVETALRGQPGTAHYTAETDQVISVAGLPGRSR